MNFHDCLRYVDGSGGCDGCLNWESVGVRYPPVDTFKYKFRYPDVNETNNNGIEHAVAIMEEIYTNQIFQDVRITFYAKIHLDIQRWKYVHQCILQEYGEQR